MFHEKMPLRLQFECLPSKERQRKRARESSYHFYRKYDATPAFLIICPPNIPRARAHARTLKSSLLSHDLFTTTMNSQWDPFAAIKKSIESTRVTACEKEKKNGSKTRCSVALFTIYGRNAIEICILP